jgi:hypothetical protein
MEQFAKVGSSKWQREELLLDGNFNWNFTSKLGSVLIVRTAA